MSIDRNIEEIARIEKNSGVKQELDRAPDSEVSTHLTDRTVFLSGKRIRNYKLGDEVSFARGGNGLLYKKLTDSLGNTGSMSQHRQNGWSFPEGEGTWIEGKEATLAMEIKGRLPRLMLLLDAYSIDFPPDRTQELKLFVNGVAVGSAMFHRVTWQKARFTFDSDLIGPDNIAHISLQTSYAARPSPDKRILSIFCRSLTIDSAPAVENYVLNSNLFLGASGNTACLDYGWSTPEDDGVWIEGREAAVDLRVDGKVADYNLAIQAKSVDLAGRNQAAQIYVNDRIIGETTLSNELTDINIQFSGSMIKPNAVTRIKIRAEHTNSPAPDPRSLSVFCRSITLQTRQ